jgi:hypothetical protein
MLTEEALILLATLGASGLLVLGIAELAWPSTPRRSAHRVRRAPSLRTEPAPPPASTPAPTPTPVTVEPVHDVVEREPLAAPWAPEAVAMPEPEPAPAPPLPEAPPLPRSVSGEPEPPRAQVLPIDTCRSMFDEGRFAEVVSLGSAALEVHARLAAVSDRPHEAAPLLDLVGRSKLELGDREGARDAFRAAVLDADALRRPEYTEHLLALIADVVDGPAEAEAGGEAARVRELRAWIGVLDEVLRAVPGDEAVLSAQSAVREALAPACERLVAHVASGAADESARSLVVEVLVDDTMPEAWRERLREQLAAASSAEIGQLTAQAIRSVQDGKDGEALEALERAELLAAALPIGAVADERREEFERRLWWGYTKVGLRRVETESFEAALEPLFRAIRLGGIDEERLMETRSALVRAVEGIVETRWPAIQQLVVEDTARAQAQLEKLSAVLRSATQRGLSPDDLGDAFARVAHLEQVLSQQA